MKYYIVDDDVYRDTIDEVMDYCVDEDYYEDDWDGFYEWVDDLYYDQKAVIGGCEFLPHEIIEDTEVESDLMRQYCEDRCERDVEDAQYELDRANTGDKIYIQRYTVEVVDDEEEEEDEEECHHAGDFDGDDILENLRMKIASCEAQAGFEEDDRIKNEKDLMDLFQVI